MRLVVLSLAALTMLAGRSAQGAGEYVGSAIQRGRDRAVAPGDMLVIARSPPARRAEHRAQHCTRFPFHVDEPHIAIVIQHWAHLSLSAGTRIAMDVSMLKPLLPIVMMALVSPSVSPCATAACRCISVDASGLTPAQFVTARRDRAERVVLGTVIRVDTLPRTSWGSGADAVQLRPVVARVRVRRVWRGPDTDTMTVMVTTAESRSSCDLEMRPAESYLIFASRTEGGPLATRQCTGTELERDAAETLAILGAGTPVRPNRE